MFALSAITSARRPARSTRRRPGPLVSMTADSADALPITTTLTTPPETRPSHTAAKWPRRPLSSADSDRLATTSSYAPATAAAVAASRAARRLAPPVPVAVPTSDPSAAARPPVRVTACPW